MTSYNADGKLKIIKEFKNFLGLGLKEAKDMVEKTPLVIKEDISKDDAEKIKALLEPLGAVIIIK